jgi:hypothetical protein
MSQHGLYRNGRDRPGALAEWMNLEVAHFFMSTALEVPGKTAGTMGIGRVAV